MNIYLVKYKEKEFIVYAISELDAEFKARARYNLKYGHEATVKPKKYTR